MSEQPEAPDERRDPRLDAAEVALRLLADQVSRKTMESVRAMAVESTSGYPWQAVHELVLAEPVNAEQLLQRGLRAQRDWLLRGGREAPVMRVGHRAKSFLAKALVQTITVLICAGMTVFMLLLLKWRWPECDIYGVLDWLRATFPGLASRG